MQSATTLYDYLYQSILTQIRCGALRRGDQLPSQTELCRQYNVGITTVRRVYRMLQAEGIVSSGARTKAVIQCDLPQEKSAGLAVMRKAIILDMFCSLAPLYPGLQAWGAMQMKDLNPLRELLEQFAKSEEQRGQLHAYSQLLDSLFLPMHNQVLMDWAQEVSHSTYIPLYATLQLDARYALPFEQFQALIQELFNAMEAGRRSQCEDLLRQIYYKGWTRAEKILNALTEDCAEVKAPAEYTWAALNSRTPKYTAVARSLSNRIRSQEFAFQPYIPSIPQLMQEYDASLATIRSAVALLNDIGLIQTAPKKGSVILRRPIPAKTVKLEIALVRENIIYFLDALQLLALCWSPLAKTVYPFLSKAECEQYAQRLAVLGLTSDSLLSELLWQLGEKVVYPGQRSLLEQLKNLLIWGYYLKHLPLDADYPDLTQPERIAAILNQLVQALNMQRTDLFIELSQALFFQAYALARSLVLYYGGQESELPAAFPTGLRLI